jgi:hypothetical protein
MAIKSPDQRSEIYWTFVKTSAPPHHMACSQAGHNVHTAPGASCCCTDIDRSPWGAHAALRFCEWVVRHRMDQVHCVSAGADMYSPRVASGQIGRGAGARRAPSLARGTYHRRAAGPYSTEGTGQRHRQRAEICSKGRALWGQRQSSYKAFGARCKISCGGGHWRLERRVGVRLGLRTCLRIEL